MPSRISSLQCVPDRQQQLQSSEAASHPALLFRYPLFNSLTDLFVFRHFAAFHLYQALFHLADKPFVVTNQTLEGFLHKRLCVTPLLRSKALEFGLQFGRKLYDHGVSLGAASSLVKPFKAVRCARHPLINNSGTESGISPSACGALYRRARLPCLYQPFYAHPQACQHTGTARNRKSV